MQQQLGLAVPADARARDSSGIGAELVLLHADRTARARRRGEAGDRAVGAARADQVTRAQARHRPQPVAVARDVLDGDAEVQLGAAAPEQEVVELDSGG